SRWAPKSDLSPLAARFKEVRFFVHNWIDAGSSTVRADWDLPALVREAKTVPTSALSLVFGLDPGNVDVVGVPLWSSVAQAAARQIPRANPNVAQLAWLNLRSYKFSIPKLRIEKSPPPDLESAARRVHGQTHVYDQYTFRSIEMCLATSAWQASRIQAL